MISRRHFLLGAALAPAFRRPQPLPGGRFAGLVPFVGGATPLGRLLGDGLDARMFTDLSTIDADSLVTPTERFFVRTAAPRTLPDSASWTVTVGGLVHEPATIDLATLQQSSQPIGRCLIECAGNADPANYGLMSVADWSGVPISTVLDRVRPNAAPHRILVSGFDTDAASRTSVPGASWIFARDDLRRAFLALQMNGAPLARDHGAPVRLVVPGWYGCACIKWVTRIDLVADDEKPTSQMWEFANRTHQPFGSRDASGSLRTGPPALARDYTPAAIDAAAVPIRIEKWIADGRLSYRIVGIMWGGEKPTSALAIRFRSGGGWTPVENCPLPDSTLTWSVWTHTWRPVEPGRYEIVLKVTDPTIRTRRLDLFYYVREVEIGEV